VDFGLTNEFIGVFRKNVIGSGPVGAAGEGVKGILAGTRRQEDGTHGEEKQ